MPIHVGAEVRQLDDVDCKACVYEVMRQVFAVHSELGRLFHEKIYQHEVAFRLAEAKCEVPIDVRFDDFCKTFYLDLLVGGGAVFEMKAVETLADRHRRQLLNYLFLTGLHHGKLVNLRPERVDHEFVNNTATLAERTRFAVVDDGWQELVIPNLKEWMTAMLHDWGVGLDLQLYENAAAHHCGQPDDAETEIAIRLDGRHLGMQRVRLIAPRVALRVTALPVRILGAYHIQLCHFLHHADLSAIQWINVTRSLVRFKTILKTHDS
jgi:GxxExxY protein